MGKERPGKRAVDVGLFRYQRPFDESRLHWGDCFPEKGLPLSLIHICLTDDDVMLLLKLIFHRQDTQELLKKLLELSLIHI